jgi:pyruvate formate-lyase activating enzyme-like uncharacterized protein
MNDSDQKSIYIESARREYGDNYDLLNWISAEKASAAAEEREKLLSWLQSRGADVLCGGTKPVCNGMSPGCQSCTAGDWSCLFINGVCNGHCFFCPADQTEMGEPTTQTIQFTDPEDYVDYIKQFRFKGVSMSGGEPLLSFERTIRFISAVKAKLGSAIHLWMYTNGKLVTRDKLQALKEAGADEIRFNIYAHIDYLQKIRMASDLINNVTVEIPAVPEYFDELKKTISDLKQNGVKFLNFHQLRLTPHNFNNLIKRNYTYLHGSKVTVLESELIALKIMKFNVESGINLAINYCSFPYKNRYQRTAERRRHALCIIKPYESLTEAGMIRSLHVKGHPQQIQTQVEHLKKMNIDESSWELSDKGDCLFFNPACWPLLDFKNFSLIIRYHDTAMMPSVSYRNMFKEIRLNERKKVVIERWPVCDEIALNGLDIAWYGRAFLNETDSVGIDFRGEKPQIGNVIDKYEKIPQGLSDYF